MDQKHERLGSRDLAEQIRREIRRGDLAPGAKLRSYRDLATTNGIAINTVREAVRQLEHEGLVAIRHGSGAYVADIDERTADEQLQDVRGELEDVRQELQRAISALSAADSRLSDAADRLGKLS
ncbi:winged helix-turn-helix domain-containing protein [Saccharopolyspora shandongensis]|uniref:GntR family transcriptional regulator n=1 Tax=Saccharopolyspora shandongensis TaxID=418495 RepID=UPI00342C7E3B